MMISIEFLIRLQAAALQLAGERAMPHLPGELTKAWTYSIHITYPENRLEITSQNEYHMDMYVPSWKVLWVGFFGVVESVK